jgi:hypothetical protein
MLRKLLITTAAGGVIISPTIAQSQTRTAPDERAIESERIHADASSNDVNNTSAADDPSNVKLKVGWTKDELRGASDFQYYNPPARTAPATTGSVPRPTAPRPQAQ